MREIFQSSKSRESGAMTPSVKARAGALRASLDEEIDRASSVSSSSSLSDRVEGSKPVAVVLEA